MTTSGHKFLPTLDSQRNQIYGFFRLSYWLNALAKAEPVKSNTKCRISSMAYLSISSDGATAKVYDHQLWKTGRMIWKMIGEHGVRPSKRRGLRFYASCGTPSTPCYSANRSACLPLSSDLIYHAISHYGKPTRQRRGTSFV